MDALNVLVNAAVFTAVALVFGYLGRERFDMLQRQIESLREDMQQRVGQVEQRVGQVEQRLLRLENALDAIRSDMSTEFGSVRSDITQIALAVGARPRPNTG